MLLPVALAVGRAIPNYGVKPFLYLGSVLAVARFLLLSTYTSPGQIEAYLVVYAFGGGILNTAFRYIGQTLGAPVAGAILSTYAAGYVIDGHLVMLPARAAFQYSFYVSVVAFLMVFLVSTFAREVIGFVSSAEIS